MTTRELPLNREPTAVNAPATWWAAVRDAVAGTHHDYTEGPVGRSLVLLAIPMVLETLMESLFAVCDVFFVSRLGPDAVATVGLTESMLTILYALAMGLSIGATATVARRIGAGDTWTPTWINLVSFWSVEIPLAYLLAITFGMGGWASTTRLASPSRCTPS